MAEKRWKFVALIKEGGRSYFLGTLLDSEQSPATLGYEVLRDKLTDNGRLRWDNNSFEQYCEACGKLGSLIVKAPRNSVEKGMQILTIDVDTTTVTSGIDNQYTRI